MIEADGRIHRINWKDVAVRFLASASGAAFGTFLFLCVAALAA